MMVVDISGSMQALDLSTDDRERTRLEAVQDVFEEFVLGGSGLEGRPDDAIGLIHFARYADTACPLTLDHPNLTALARETSRSFPTATRTAPRSATRWDWPSSGCGNRLRGRASHCS